MKDKSLLEQVRRINRIFLQPVNGDPSINEGVKALADVMQAAAFVTDNGGKLLASHVMEGQESRWLTQLVEKVSLAGSTQGSSLFSTSDVQFNVNYVSETALNDGYVKSEESTGKSILTVVPIFSGGLRIATLVLCRSTQPFEHGHLILAEIGAAMIGLLLMQASVERQEENSRSKVLAKVAFESLSYSEVEAIQEVLKNIKGNESVIVASKIADSLGITRSVIVNALRKFESAGIIASRSLGMKGTFIRIKNKQAFEEIAAFSEKFKSLR
ncbi:MAG TPA: hypothetical protein VLH18_00045 [Candidatus Limnocylindrales bacterium]|nr:hypothetical protein [Candidatus Limnocylindrales bacterium]